MDYFLELHNNDNNNKMMNLRASLSIITIIYCHFINFDSRLAFLLYGTRIC